MNELIGTILFIVFLVMVGVFFLISVGDQIFSKDELPLDYAHMTKYGVLAIVCAGVAVYCYFCVLKAESVYDI